MPSEGFLVDFVFFSAFHKSRHYDPTNHHTGILGGQAMEKLTAKDIMNPDVLTVNTELSLQGLADFFFQNAISGAPVISDDGKLIGAVSITDILRRETVPEKGVQYSPYSSYHDYYVQTTDDRFSHQDLDALHFTDEASATVGDIMTSRILVVERK